MVLPKTNQAANAHSSERRHTDPPALWIGVTLSSVVIHLLAFGVLRLLFAGSLNSFKVSRELISVDLIAVAPKTTSSVQSVQTPGLVNPRNQTPRDTPTGRITAPLAESASNPSASRTDLRSPTAPPAKRSPAALPAPNQPPNNSSGSNSPNVSPQRYPNIPPSPDLTDSSSNQFPNKPPRPISDNSSSEQFPNKPPRPNSDDSSSNPFPDNSSGSNSGNSSPGEPSNNPSDSTSSNPQQGGGFLASVVELRLSVPDTDVPTQLAKPTVQQKKFASNDSAAQLVAKLDQPVVLQVLVRIDRNGTPSAQSAKVLEGSSNVDPNQLAQAIVQNWQFEPTRMEGGAVDQEYYLRLNINPLPK
jgi:hypothetical protein